jgi:hypothetical protein
MGDHTLREYRVCDRPYMPAEEDPSLKVREQFGFDADQAIADHVDVKAGHIATQVGNFPVLMFDFGISISGVVQKAARVVYTAGDAQSMRQFGRLMRDSANGAANRAERADGG